MARTRKSTKTGRKPQGTSTSYLPKARNIVKKQRVPRPRKAIAKKTLLPKKTSTEPIIIEDGQNDELAPVFLTPVVDYLKVVLSDEIASKPTLRLAVQSKLGKQLKLQDGAFEFMNFYAEIKDWNLDYFFREGSHQLEFRIIGDSVRFFYLTTKGWRSKDYDAVSFSVDLTSCMPKSNDLASMLFKFKKLLLKEEHQVQAENPDFMRFLPPTTEQSPGKPEVPEQDENKPNQPNLSFGKGNEASIVSLGKNVGKEVLRSPVSTVEKKKNVTFSDKTNDRMFYDKETLDLWKRSHVKA